jgi:hypothetical protein
VKSGRSDLNRYLVFACRACSAGRVFRADGGNRTRRPRFGGPLCHLNTSPAWWSPGEETSSIAVGARRHGSTIYAWVEWESNPRFDGVRVRCKASVCYRPVSQSHPLESNQNLSGFNQARSLLRQGGKFRAAHRRSCPRRAALFRSGALPGTRHRHLFGCHRGSRSMRTQGAPRAAMHPHAVRPHLSRFMIMSVNS